MSTRTGGFRFRVGGVFRRVLVLQLEFERQRRISATSWPSRCAPERYWRDATLEDLTAEPAPPTQRPAPPPARDS